MPGNEIQGLRLAGKYDGFLDETTPQGIGGVFVRAYNFTDKPIVMLDANNNATYSGASFKDGSRSCRWGSYSCRCNVFKPRSAY